MPSNKRRFKATSRPSALPELVRQSELAQALEEKLSSGRSGSFDYWGEFKRLRDRISAEMGEMKQLFPWYTPHDEEHHLSRLFGIADKMLGPERYGRMNLAELFLLACGLYAHDWGMAVGADEIAYLRRGASLAANESVFVPLDDEASRLRSFVEEHGLRSHFAKGFPEINDDYLRAYVRMTHAWRSGVRARAFFKAAGASVPQALERVCQGHWLDYSELDNETRFPLKYGVLGDSVNLRAIALYVRLVDLCDVADDRTPYAIWRFVAPRDPQAKMEWSKHRALSPVTFIEYADGRAIRFDGTTSDPEIWAELEDLRRYCEDQVTGANDLLARHLDERHTLDLRKVQWEVGAERFTPINIRFEFHRQRMFEILADEIYQGDSYVFLRELLQNSIDATRMRSELARTMNTGGRRDCGIGFDDAIYFEVEHHNDGDAVIRCRDFGIGMDEYIVRNYLAVAGVSYYHSNEFRNLGLKMDPISHFGVGILSCFMVAERVEIETARDPRVAREAKPLRIDIPAVDRQFRCYPGEKTAEVGTVITVHVLGSKLKSHAENGEEKPQRLKVAEYLAEIASFVEFPIVIDEDGNRTVILHPNRPETDADCFAADGKRIKVRQLSRHYPWNESFIPQDVSSAEELLQVRTFDLRNDLGIQDFEGWVSYVVPKNERCQVRWEYSSVFVGEQIDGKTRTELRLARRRPRMAIAPSSSRNAHFTVYRDGLLIADATPPGGYYDSARAATAPWPAPVLRVNLPKASAGAVDVARRTFKGLSKTWDHQIWNQVGTRLRDQEFLKELLSEPSVRLDRFAELACVYGLDEDDLIKLVPQELWPGPVLEETGEVSISNLPFGPDQTLLEIPTLLEAAVWQRLRWASFQYGKISVNFESALKYWRGGRAIGLQGADSLTGLQRFWMNATTSRYKTRLVPVTIRFLNSPIPGLAPVPQTEFMLKEPSQLDEKQLLENAMANPEALTSAQRCGLRHNRVHRYKFERLFGATPFAAPFNDCLAWGGQYFNITHPTVCALFRCSASLEWYRRVHKKSEADLGRVDDCLSHILNILGFGPSEKLQIELGRLWGLIRKTNLIELSNEPPVPEPKDFVWGSTKKRLVDLPNFNKSEWQSVNSFVEYLRPFGHMLTSATPEELPESIQFLERDDIY
jgi:hypothetical protein